MINTANTRAVENHWGYPYNIAILKRKNLLPVTSCILVDIRNSRQVCFIHQVSQNIGKRPDCSERYYSGQNIHITSR